MAAAASATSPIAKSFLGKPTPPSTLTMTKTNRLWLKVHGFVFVKDQWKHGPFNTISEWQQRRFILAEVSPNDVRVGATCTGAPYWVLASVETSDLDLPCEWPKTAKGNHLASLQFNVQAKV